MNATVIDTLRFADRLKEAGFEAPHAEGMARALGDELAERMLTRNDLDERLRPIYSRLDGMDDRFDAMDARFDAMDTRFDAMDARFDAMDTRFDGIDGKLVGVDARFRAMDARFDGISGKLVGVDARFRAMDARFDAMDAKIDSVHRELSGKLNMMVGVMALGFTLLVGLGGYNAVSPRFAQATMPTHQTQQEATELPGRPPSQPLAEG